MLWGSWKFCEQESGNPVCRSQLTENLQHWVTPPKTSLVGRCPSLITNWLVLNKISTVRAWINRCRNYNCFCVLAAVQRWQTRFCWLRICWTKLTKWSLEVEWRSRSWKSFTTWRYSVSSSYFHKVCNVIIWVVTLCASPCQQNWSKS